MNTETKEIYAEKLLDKYEDIENLWEIFAGGLRNTMKSMDMDAPNNLSRMHLTCDIYSADKLAYELKELCADMKEMRGEFVDEVNHAR